MASMFYNHRDLDRTDDPDVARAVAVNLDRNAFAPLSFDGTGWLINPFPDMSLEAAVSSTSQKNGYMRYRGTASGADFVLVTGASGRPDDFAADIWHPDGQIQILHQGGELIARQLQPRLASTCGVAGGTASVDSGEEGEAEDKDDPAVAEVANVRILVLYTDEVSASVGAEELGRRLALVEEEFETAFGNSSVTEITVDLVATEEIAWTEAATCGADLDAMAINSTVIERRDSHDADLVILVRRPEPWVNGKRTAGIANLLNSRSDPEGQAAMAVVHDLVTDDALFVHEVGHLLGCNHNPERAPSRRLYSYALGHYFDDENSIERGTIMSYKGRRILHFSNPDVTAHGKSTGITDQRDNARCIRNSKAFVAAYAETRTANESNGARIAPTLNPVED